MGDVVKLGSFSKKLWAARGPRTCQKAAGSSAAHAAAATLIEPTPERARADVESHPSQAWTRSLLPGNTESLTGSAGGLRVLALDLEAPEVTKTSVLADLLHALLVFSEFSINCV